MTMIMMVIATTMTGIVMTGTVMTGTVMTGTVMTGTVTPMTSKQSPSGSVTNTGGKSK